MTKTLNIFTDGGARGNPGPAAIGVYIESGEGKEIAGFGKKIGVATNNAAEYKGVMEALIWVVSYQKTHDVKVLNFYLDSRLVCSQINGLFKIKNADLRNYLLKVRELEGGINCPIHYNHILREKNKKADSFVNQALDSRF